MSNPHSNPPASQSFIPAIESGVVLGLFLMRFFLVAESAGQGDTLWIVALWILALLALTIVSWWQSALPQKGVRPLATEDKSEVKHNRERVRPRFEAKLWQPLKERSFGCLDLSVGLLAGGHIVSAMAIIATTGEKRSAMNLAWEWVGVAIGWYLLRKECRSTLFRREILAALVSVGVVTAGLGVYQHYVEFPRLSATYGQKFDQLKNANVAEAATIRRELAKDQIPIDGPAALLFEKRLRDSREPLGLFALANTLGGFLAVGLILSVSVVASFRKPREHGAWKQLLPWISIITLIGWCLLLTKSRTAWIGTAAGLALFSVGTGRVKLSVDRLRFVGGILVVLILFGWGLSRIGGLDRQVLTEAPKSLQYRLQYWSATWPMIKDHLWLGVGPGQFRSHYLFYKKAEASEEISDPHNLFLDAAANGGVAAFAGVLLLCFSLAMKFRNLDSDFDQFDKTPTHLTIPRVVSSMSFVAWLALLFTGDDDRLLVLIPISVVIYWGLRRSLIVEKDNLKQIQVGVLAAGFALIVHLLGAGGIGMPAVSILLLSLAAMTEGGRISSTTSHQSIFSVFSGGLASLSLGLLFGIYFTGLKPVGLAQKSIRAGDRLVQDRLAEAADTEYSKAAAADEIFGEPWQRRAELAFRQAQADRFRSNESFLKAARFLEEARVRDPANPQYDRRIGDWLLTRWRVTGWTKDVEEAVAAYDRAWHRYPTNALLMSELALAFDAAKISEAAVEVAEKALEQDRINHERGHVDRYLAESVRDKLKNMKLNRK